MGWKHETRKLITCYECVLLDPEPACAHDRAITPRVSWYLLLRDAPTAPYLRPPGPLLHLPLYTFTLPAPASRPSPMPLPTSPLPPYRTVVIFSNGKVFKELHACAFLCSQTPGQSALLCYRRWSGRHPWHAPFRTAVRFAGISSPLPLHPPSFPSKPIDFHTFLVPISHGYSEVLLRPPHAIDYILNVKRSPPC